MDKLRAELAWVVDELLQASAASGEVTLDAIGVALGALAVSTDEIELILCALERRGRAITAPEGGGAEAHLKQVVRAARMLKASLARRPTLREVANEAQLTQEQTLIALALLRVMQR